MGSFYQDHCVYLPAMLGWFLFSALLSSYNKYIFGDDHVHFPCPLFMTSIHFFVQWIVSETICAIFPIATGSDRITAMSWQEWASVSIPCGMVTALDVGLSNLSTVTISITFHTMIKASTPIFVLIWAYLFGIEKITWTLLGVVFLIAAGEYLTVMGEGVNFVLHGFLLCLSASVLSGARWTLVQMKIQRLDPPLATTLATMRLLAPSMFASLLLVSLVIERPWNRLPASSFAEAVTILGLGLFGAVFAICMVLCEFWLIMKSSAVVLMIGGVMKEMVTIVVGVTAFHDRLNSTNIMGCLVVFGGVLLYKFSHYYENHIAGKTGHGSTAGSAAGTRHPGPPKAFSAMSDRGSFVAVDNDEEEDDDIDDGVNINEHDLVAATGSGHGIMREVGGAAYSDLLSSHAHSSGEDPNAELEHEASSSPSRWALLDAFMRRKAPNGIELRKKHATDAVQTTGHGSEGITGGRIPGSKPTTARDIV